MANAFYPRISQAKDLLPIIRAHLVAAAAHHSLPDGLSLDLLPIVEDGLVGYEFQPNRATDTYLTIGCDHRGVPTLRASSYRAEPPCALRVACINGHLCSQSELNAGHRLQQRDSVLPNWSSAAEAAWTELATLFPQQPRQCVEVHDAPHACLDKALAFASARLAVCDDPCIDFCGVPDEAQYGFALTHANGGRGRLTCRQTGRWVLWFQAAATTLHEEWSIVLPGIEVAAAWVCAGTPPRYATPPATFAFPSLAAASSRGPRKERIGDRRRADRRHPDGQYGARHHEDRRRRDRRQNTQGSGPGYDS